MNSSFRSVQILVDLLKQYKIRDVVLSPGGSDIPLIHSIETDEYFTCYSVVDERSAAYFAMGVAQQKSLPVACVCTSGTAVCNYLPGITEAFYQSVPVLAITADKNPYYQGQLEIQKIEQTHIFDGVVKKSVDLPVIQNSEDEWLCNRLVNEAMIALTHHGCGPVQINVPIVGRTDLYNDKTLPPERKINVVKWLDGDEIWDNYAKKLVSAKRVLFVMGQGVTFTPKIVSLLEELHKKCNCVYSVEHLSNLDCEGCIHTYPVSEINGGSSLEKLVPEIVVSIGDNLSAYNLRPFLRRHYFDKSVFKFTMPLCFAMLLQTIVNSANGNVDKFLISVMLSPEAVSVYAISTMLFTTYSAIGCIPLSMYMPTIADSLKKGVKGEELSECLVKPCRLNAFILGVLAFGILVVGQQFFVIVYGAEYSESWIYAIIVIFPILFNEFNNVIINVMDILNRRQVRSFIMMITTVFNIIGSILAIKFWGMLGAAIVTGISYVLQTVILNIYYKKKLGINVCKLFKESFNGIFLCLIIAAAVSFPLRYVIGNLYAQFFVCGGVFCIVFFVLFVLFGANKEEKMILLRIKNKTAKKSG